MKGTVNSWYNFFYLYIYIFCGRLLLEDSDEEEGDLCRICQMGQEQDSNPLIQPCRCTGSLQYVHQECIKRWLRSKIGSGTSRPLMGLQLSPVPRLLIKVKFDLFIYIFLLFSTKVQTLRPSQLVNSARRSCAWTSTTSTFRSYIGHMCKWVISLFLSRKQNLNIYSSQNIFK